MILFFSCLVLIGWLLKKNWFLVVMVISFVKLFVFIVCVVFVFGILIWIFFCEINEVVINIMVSNINIILMKGMMLILLNFFMVNFVNFLIVC